MSMGKVIYVRLWTTFGTLINHLLLLPGILITLCLDGNNPNEARLIIVLTDTDLPLTLNRWLYCFGVQII